MRSVVLFLQSDGGGHSGKEGGDAEDRGLTAALGGFGLGRSLSGGGIGGRLGGLLGGGLLGIGGGIGLGGGRNCEERVYLTIGI